MFIIINAGKKIFLCTLLILRQSENLYVQFLEQACYNYFAVRATQNQISRKADLYHSIGHISQKEGGY